jgi:cytochrome c biogenesis factor
MIFLGIGSLGIDLGLLLLLISLLAFILDILFVFMGENIEKWEEYSELNFIVGCSAFLISFLYFSFSIVTADYNFFHVSEYVSNDMDFFLRLSAIWSSQAGSFFFWGFSIVILYIVFRTLFQKYSHETIFYRSFLLMAFQVATMIVLTIMSDPFKLNTTTITDGLGLNPLLMNIWNVIHPPIIFIGDALCLIPMVIAITRLSILEDGKVPEFEGKEKLDSFFEFMVSFAWLVLSSGIIVGGYWAYITLGWGGFWAWDPVETASLIPWLFLTLYYHGKPIFGKREYLSNYIVSMSYLGALFVTYITRSGIISSVHAFTPGGTLERLLSMLIPEDSFIMAIILRFIPEERMFFLFIFILGTFLLPLIYGIANRELFKFSFPINRKDLERARYRTTALKISFLSAIIGTYILIIGLIFPVIYDILGYLITFSKEGFGPTITIGQPFYNTILTIFGGIMLLAQFFCTFYPKLSVNKKFGLLTGGLVAGVIFTVSGIIFREGELVIPWVYQGISDLVTNIFRLIVSEGNPITEFLSNFWTTSDKANFVLPLLFLGIIGLIAEFISVAMKEEKHLLRKSSRIMLHFSFLIIIIGAIMSTNMTNTTEILLVEGQESVIPGTSIKITIQDMDKNFPESGPNFVEYDTEFLLSSGSRFIGYGISRLSYDKHNRMGHKVTIISDFLSDIYIVTVAVFEDVFGSFGASRLQIKTIPYINILWAGCLLLHFAIIPLSIGKYSLFKKSYSIKEEYLEEDSRELDQSKQVVNNRGDTID